MNSLRASARCSCIADSAEVANFAHLGAQTWAKLATSAKRESGMGEGARDLHREGARVYPDVHGPGLAELVAV